jgi:hypothetical protein
MYSVKKRSRKEKAVSASISHDIGRIAIAHVEKYSGMLGNASCGILHLNIFRVICGDRKTANFDEHITFYS